MKTYKKYEHGEFLAISFSLKTAERFFTFALLGVAQIIKRCSSLYPKVVFYNVRKKIQFHISDKNHYTVYGYIVLAVTNYEHG